MKLYLTFLFFITSLRFQGTKWNVEEENDVAILTSKNFDEFIQNHRLVMVKFYAPWCGHCKSMAPAYSALAKKMKEKGIPVAKVDATVESEIASKYAIQGYPTLALFMDGNMIDYKGARTEEAIYQFLMSVQNIKIPEITTEGELNAEAAKKISVVYFISHGDKEAIKLLEMLQATFEDIPFSYCYDKKLKEKYDTSPYVLSVFRSFDEGQKSMVTPKLPKFNALKKFINALRYPIVMDLDEMAAKRIFGAKKPTMILFSENDNSQALEDFSSVAKANPSSMLYAHSKIKSGFGTRIAEFLGVKATDDPTVKIMDFENNAVNKYSVSDISSIGLKKALHDYNEKKLKPYYKSEAIPESNEGSVKIVVGDSFDEIVINNDKHVLLEAYAPWCGHCKQLEPIYNQLGEKLKKESDIVIAKMDATVNEHPTIKVQGFPTIYLYKAGSKNQPEKYEGARDLESLVKFLEEKVGRKFNEGNIATEEL